MKPNTIISRSQKIMSIFEVQFSGMPQKSESLLKENNLKLTPGRIKVLSFFLDADYALSYNDIQNKYKPEMDKVTIYRTLNTFKESGILHEIVSPDGVSKYALCKHHQCNHNHHHHDKHIHFYCITCENIYCLSDLKITTLNLPDGYKANTSKIVVEGTCKSCNAV